MPKTVETRKRRKWRGRTELFALGAIVFGSQLGGDHTEGFLDSGICAALTANTVFAGGCSLEREFNDVDYSRGSFAWCWAEVSNRNG